MSAAATRILIVEDDADHARILRVLLDRPGRELVYARDLAGGRAALAAEPPPDLVILDLILPDGNGLSLCRESKRANPNTPVVVVTAWAQSSVEEEAASAGADRILTKPFRLDEFESVVASLLGEPRGRARPA